MKFNVTVSANRISFSSRVPMLFLSQILSHTLPQLHTPTHPHLRTTHTPFACNDSQNANAQRDSDTEKKEARIKARKSEQSLHATIQIEVLYIIIHCTSNMIFAQPATTIFNNDIHFSQQQQLRYSPAPIPGSITISHSKYCQLHMPFAIWTSKSLHQIQIQFQSPPSSRVSWYDLTG